jgi:SAM-dependent methyltransferase
MREYYDRRAPEYDATAYEAADAGEVASLTAWVAGLARGRVLDVACGTGYLTRFLRGEIVALDQSQAMLEIASERVPGAELVRTDVPPCPSMTTSSTASLRVTSTAIWPPPASASVSSTRRSAWRPRSLLWSRDGVRGCRTRDVGAAPAWRRIAAHRVHALFQGRRAARGAARQGRARDAPLHRARSASKRSTPGYVESPPCAHGKRSLPAASRSSCSRAVHCGATR